MSNSATAMNMGNARRKKRNERRNSENVEKSFLSTLAKRQVCELRHENFASFEDKESGLFISSVMAVILSDFHPDVLTAEEAIEVIENINLQTNCSNF